MSIYGDIRVELASIYDISKSIFPINAPEGQSLPYLVYNLDDRTREQEIANGHNGEVLSRYQLDIYHNGYMNLRSLMDSIISKIKTFNMRQIGTNGVYIQQAVIVNEFENYEPTSKSYHGTIEIELYYNEEE